MQISRLALKLIAALGIAAALTLGFAGGVGAQTDGYDGYEGEEEACDPSLEGVAGYEGYDGYEGCDETTTPTTSTPTTTPVTTPAAGGSALPDTGGMTMLAAAGVVGAIGLTIRRLATS